MRTSPAGNEARKENMKLKVVKPFDDTNTVVYKSDKPSLTDPSFTKESDIGYLIEQYRVNRIPLPTVNVQYGTSPTADEYTKAMEMVASLKSQFELLPSNVRDRFQTVQNYLEFIGNPSNLRESYEKGYIDPSTVDLSVVYPERYNNTTPNANSQPQPSQPSSDEQKTVNANG